MHEREQAFSYTPLFCEENIWLLATKLIEQGISEAGMFVLFFSNAFKTIILYQQKTVQQNQYTVWDYHVVLQSHHNETDAIYDFDTRLPFPCPLEKYLSLTFTDQGLLPERFRTRIRQIPAGEYLQRFCSDRSHMRGKIGADRFPGYPIIQPDSLFRPIPLCDYWNMDKQLDDDSRVVDLEAYPGFKNRQQLPP